MLKNILKFLYKISPLDCIINAIKSFGRTLDETDTKLFSPEGYRDLNDDETYKEIERKRIERRNGK